MLEIRTMTANDFLGLQGDGFTVEIGSETFDLTLIEVKKLGQSDRAGGAFSVLWQGPQSPQFVQATYIVSHAEIGSCEIFLVPVAQTDAGFQYEAIFG